MWADTVFQAEQLHLHQLLVWSGLSLGVAAILAVALAARRSRSSLLTNFAGQMAAWGVLIGAVAWIEVARLHLPDLAGATRLERTLWMSIGFDTAYIGVGATLALTAWLLARRLGPVGAGVAIVVQGLALLTMHAQLIAAVAR